MIVITIAAGHAFCEVGGVIYFDLLSGHSFSIYSNICHCLGPNDSCDLKCTIHRSQLDYQLNHPYNAQNGALLDLD